MKTPPSPKRLIIIKSLRKQLSIMTQNLHQFGLSTQETHRFLIEVILCHQNLQNPQDSKQQLSSSVKKLKPVKQNLSINNIVDFVIEDIEVNQISDKLLLEYLHNVYDQNSSLTNEFFISLSSSIETKNETEHKLVESLKRMSKYEEKASTQIKNCYEETLYLRRDQFFQKDSIFMNRDSSFQIEDQYDNDEALELESSRLSSRIDSLALMQEEMGRLREMQKKYQHELEVKVIETKKLLNKNTNPFSFQSRAEFSSIYSRNIQS